MYLFIYLLIYSFIIYLYIFTIHIKSLFDYNNNNNDNNNNDDDDNNNNKHIIDVADGTDIKITNTELLIEHTA